MKVSEPQVIIREKEGVKIEPFEEVVIDMPAEYQGAIIERLGVRGFVMTNVIAHKKTSRLFFARSKIIS